MSLKISLLFHQARILLYGIVLFMPWMTYHFDTLPSTNLWAKQHLASFPIDSYVRVTADSQTAGRGQYGKSWISPPGVNLYITFCCIRSSSQADAGYVFSLTRLLAETTQEMLQTYQVFATVKWPNDLLVAGKKLAGILCETTPFPPSPHTHVGILMGIGININMPTDMLLTIDQPATSLQEILHAPQDRTLFLETLSQRFENRLSSFFSA